MTNISEVFRIGQRNSQVFQKGSGPLWWVSPCRCVSLLPGPRPTCCAWVALIPPRSTLHWIWWAEDIEQWVRAEGDKGSEESAPCFSGNFQMAWCQSCIAGRLLDLFLADIWVHPAFVCKHLAIDITPDSTNLIRRTHILWWRASPLFQITCFHLT